MTHASLFSGIGGFDLAAQWAGWTNVFNCEIDPFCQKVLKHHFPYATQYSDIKSTDFTIWRGRIDVLTGGFPCQPFSLAGKRKGTEDDRHLWPQMLRAIREISPRWVVGENVLGILSWSNGLVFEQVCADLEAEGYEVQPIIIPACGVGAPHQRYRVWFVAHHSEKRWEQRSGQTHQREECPQKRRGIQCSANGPCGGGTPSDTECLRGREVYNKIQSEQSNGVRVDSNGNKRTTADTDDERFKQQPRNTLTNQPRQSGWRDAPCGFDAFPTQPPVCSRDDGLSSELDGITFPKWRMQSIKAYGNAIVPQVALQIMEAINEIEQKQDNP